MLKKDAQGRLRQSEALVETERGPLSHHVVSFHRTMLTRAAVSAKALRLARELYEEELGALIDARLDDDSLSAVHVERLRHVRDQLDR